METVKQKLAVKEEKNKVEIPERQTEFSNQKSQYDEFSEVEKQTHTDDGFVRHSSPLYHQESFRNSFEAESLAQQLETLK